MDESGKARLSQAMEQRRIELRMAWQDVAKAAGLSVAGIGAIRRGERDPLPLTRRKLEDALQWEDGSIEAILTGGEPTPIGDDDNGGNGPSADDDEVRRLRAEVQELRAEIKRLSARKKRTTQENDAQNLAGTES